MGSIGGYKGQGSQEGKKMVVHALCVYVCVVCDSYCSTLNKFQA